MRICSVPILKPYYTFSVGFSKYILRRVDVVVSHFKCDLAVMCLAGQILKGITSSPASIWLEM